MMPLNIGRVSGVKAIEGRPDIVIVDVFLPLHSGQFNCAIDKVTLNGKVASDPAAVVAFVTAFRQVFGEVTNPDWARAIGDVTPCDGIALTALE
jgi:hypothetical protein